MRSLSTLIIAVLLVLQAACGGGGSSSPEANPPSTANATEGKVGLAVQWPASFARSGEVRTASITLPSQVVSLSMTIQVLGNFPGRITDVTVDRDNGTRINGEPDSSGVSGIFVSVPVGEAARIYVTGSAQVSGRGAVTFTGVVDLPVDLPDRMPVPLFEGTGEGRIPTIASVNAPADSGAQVGQTVTLSFTAAFNDDFQAEQPKASYSSSDTDVATVDDQGVVTLVGPGSAVVTITVDGVDGQVTITSQNSAPVLDAVADQTSDDGAVINLPLAASDVDNDSLTFVANGLPIGLVIDAATGAITGTVDSAAARDNAVEVTVSDGALDASQTFAWHVNDATAPAVTPPADVTVEATGPATPVALGAGTAVDLVDGDLVPQPDNLGPYARGTTIVTWSASDTAGNIGTATQRVIVNDTTGPAVTPPADVTVEATGPATPVALGAATATDLVDGDRVPAPDNSGPYAVGDTVVTWTAVDLAGNFGNATQTVTVQDTTPPAVTPPADITIEATELPMPVALGAGTATDLVDGDLVPAPDNLGPFALGANLVTWSVADGAGNLGSAVQTVTVQDTTPPAVTLIFPLRGIVGAATDVTVVATDLTGVNAVQINGVDAAKDPFVADQWTAPNVPIALAAVDLTVVATDGHVPANTTPAPVVLTTVDGGGVASTGAGTGEFQSPGDLVLEVDGGGSVTGIMVADHGATPLARPADVFLGGLLRVNPTTGARAEVTGVSDFSFSDSLLGGDVDTFSIPGLTAGANFYAWTYNGVSTPMPDTLLGTFDDANGLIAANDNTGPIGDGFASGIAGRVNPSGTIVLKVTGTGDNNFDGINDISGAAHNAQGSYELFVAVAPPDGSNPFITPDALTVTDAAEVLVLDSGVDSTGTGSFFGALLTGGGAPVGSNDGPPSAGSWIDLTFNPFNVPGLLNGILVLDSSECSNVVQVDRATGAQALAVGGTNPCFPGALDVDTTSLLSVGGLGPDPRVYRIAPDGSGTVLSGNDFSLPPVLQGNGPLFTSPVNLTVASDGQIWVVDDSLNAVFAVDPANGDRTLVSGNGVGLNGPAFLGPMAIAVDSRGRVFILALGDDGICTYQGVWQVNSATEDLGPDGTAPFGSRALISTTLLGCASG